MQYLYSELRACDTEYAYYLYYHTEYRMQLLYCEILKYTSTVVQVHTSPTPVVLYAYHCVLSTGTLERAIRHAFFVQ